MALKDPVARKAYLKQYHAEWYKKNKEKRKLQIEEYKNSQPNEWRKSIGRKFHLRTRYNISPQEYETKLVAQDYCCAICGKDVIDNVRNGITVALSVDHCHTTNKLRDLLCHQCNSGLGQFKDNIDVLQKAIDYLRKHMV